MIATISDSEWYSIYSKLYQLNQCCIRVVEEFNGTNITSISPTVKSLRSFVVEVSLVVDSIIECFMYGFKGLSMDDLLNLFDTMCANESVLEETMEIVFGLNLTTVTRMQSWFCFLFNSHTVCDIAKRLENHPRITDYYDYSLFCGSNCVAILSLVLDCISKVQFSLPLQVPKDGLVTRTYSLGSSTSLLKSFFSIVISSIHLGVNYIDSYVGDVVTGRTSKQISVENDYSLQSPSFLLRWLRPATDRVETEAVLSVPRVFSAMLSWVEKHWSSLDMCDVIYKQDDVISTLEYYHIHNTLPDSMDAITVVSILGYVLDNLQQSLLPSDHYQSILYVMLLHDVSQQIHSLQSIIHDIPSLHKVMLDRIITTFSQLLLTYQAQQAQQAVNAIAHSLSPFLLKPIIPHQTEEGEREAVSQVIILLLTHPAEILITIRKEIETMNMMIIDKKLRIRAICDKIDIPVEFDLSTHSSYLLNRLWSCSIGLFYRSQGQSEPSYTPVSPYWRLIGFQRETPLTDFRGGGLLALEHLLAFVESHPQFVIGLIKEKSELKLPLAIACINLSILLMKELSLYDLKGTIETSTLASMTVWPLANSPSFLTQLFIIVAEVTFHFFQPGEAFFLQFTPLLQDITAAVKKTVSSGIASVDVFRTRLIRETWNVRGYQKGKEEEKEKEKQYHGLLETTQRICMIGGVCVDEEETEKDKEESSLLSSLITTTPSLSLSLLSSIQSYLQSSLQLQSTHHQLLYRAGPSASLTHLLDAARGIPHTVLYISDGYRSLCGCYYEQPWRYSTSFYGDGVSLLFHARLDDDWTVKSYPCSRLNSFYRVSTEAMVIVGGGSRHALLIDSQLTWGSSGESNTYRNKCLMDDSDFYCAVVELWRIVV